MPLIIKQLQINEELGLLRENTITIEIPRGADILSAGEEHFDSICIWYRCDPSQPLEKRYLEIVEVDGEPPSPENSIFLGTSRMHGGSYITHIFERIDK